MGQVLLVRHGQASFGADDYDVLSPTGWEQGRALGASLRALGVTPSAWVRGDMRRHRETAEAMADGGGWQEVLAREPVVVDADWDEFDHVGLVQSFPGLPPGELDRRAFQQVFERATASWIAGAHPPGDDGETWVAFVARVRAALDRVLERSGPGRTSVVVTSGGTIAVAAALLVGGTDDPAAVGVLWQRLNTTIVNSSLTRVVVGSTGARLLTYNEHTHLSADLLTYR